MSPRFLFINIIFFYSFTFIKVEAKIDGGDFPCEDVGKYGRHFAGDDDNCDSVGKVAIKGSCTAFKICNITPGTPAKLSTYSECPSDHVFDIAERKCKPGKYTENCPQIKCFPNEKHEHPHTTPIYDQPEPVTYPPGSGDRANSRARAVEGTNAGSTSTQTFTLAIAFIATAVLMPLM